MAQTTLFARKGTSVLIHREGNLTPCPCLTPEGYRDPVWHKQNPDAPICNDEGFLSDPVETFLKGFVQPATSARARSSITQMFGEVLTDDHLGLFPPSSVVFDNWNVSGSEYIEYNGMRFIVIGYSRVPDPDDYTLIHHWELALRRINTDPS